MSAVSKNLEQKPCYGAPERFVPYSCAEAVAWGLLATRFVLPLLPLARQLLMQIHQEVYTPVNHVMNLPSLLHQFLYHGALCLTEVLVRYFQQLRLYDHRHSQWQYQHQFKLNHMLPCFNNLSQKSASSTWCPVRDGRICLYCCAS